MIIHNPSEWLSALAAAELSCRSVSAVQTAGRRGAIRVLHERGSPPRYHRRDTMVWAGFLKAK